MSCPRFCDYACAEQGCRKAAVPDSAGLTQPSHLCQFCCWICSSPAHCHGRAPALSTAPVSQSLPQFAWERADSRVYCILQFLCFRHALDPCRLQPRALGSLRKQKQTLRANTKRSIADVCSEQRHQ